MIKDRVLGHGDDNEYTWQSRPFRGCQVRRRKSKGKGKGKGGFKRFGRAFLGEEQAQDLEWQSEEDRAWWSNGKRGKKGFSESTMKAFRKEVFALTNQHRVQTVISTRTKAEARTKKERAKKGAYPQSGLSLASEVRSEERNGHSWETDEWFSSYWH